MPIKSYNSAPATKPSEPTYETPSENQYASPLYYNSPSKETKPEATPKPTPGPKYYKPIDKPHQPQRRYSRPAFKSEPISADLDSAEEFGAKSVPSISQKKPTVYKSSYKILKPKPAQRRNDEWLDDENFEFSNSGFLDDGHFATDIWDMFNDDAWGQRIQ